MMIIALCVVDDEKNGGGKMAAASEIWYKTYFFSTGFCVEPVPANSVLVIFQRSEVVVFGPKPQKIRCGTDAPAWHLVCSNR
jgi:hypothetical protein